ncbi:recombinase zinc beta ribbon domain-containing protein [Micromonospora sp. C97]|nr:recombinase zinc beta ribbon domain-containing protein [Micromonospora sp. C97]
MWNKQRTDEVLLDVDDVAMGHTGVMRWNARDKWVVSKEITHEPLIDDATFEQAKAILQRRGRGTGGQHVRQRTRNPYVFRGLIYCAACDRRMQGQYNHGDAYYRCRFPQEYALANQVPHPRNVYLREDALTDPLDSWLASAFAPHRIAQTITAMADAQPLNHPPTTGAAAQAIITECDAKLERYRGALDAGADPAVVTGWIAQTQAERTRAEAELHAIAGSTPRRMSRAEITALVTALGDTTTVFRDADPADKAEVYRQLGLRLNYQPETQTVRAAVDLSAHRGPMGRVRGATRTNAPPPLKLGATLKLTQTLLRWWPLRVRRRGHPARSENVPGLLPGRHHHYVCPREPSGGCCRSGGPDLRASSPRLS